LKIEFLDQDGFLNNENNKGDKGPLKRGDEGFEEEESV